MQMIRYSQTTGAFYPLDINYPPDTLPDDLVDVSMDSFRAVMARPSGATFDFVHGELVITEAPPETVDQIRERALTEIRTQRAPILTALAGIAVDAVMGGDTETQAAVAAARQGLKDLTAIPEFLAAMTYDDMKTAVMARYRELADAAPENVKTAFREVFG